MLGDVIGRAPLVSPRHVSAATRRTWLLGAAVALACAGGDPYVWPTTGSGLGDEACVTTRASWPQRSFTNTQRLSDDMAVSGSFGVVVTPDGASFAFDGSLMRIARIAAGNAAVSFGRVGAGPGEFRRPLSGDILIIPLGGTADWLAATGDTLIVFDGHRLQHFTTRGAYVGDVPGVRDLAAGGFAAAGGPYIVRRIRADRGAVLLGMEREGNRSPRGRDFTLWRFGVASPARRIYQLQLPGMPSTSAGGYYRGPREATPIWDAYAGCMVVSDGFSPYLLVSSDNGGTFDTIGYRLPAREPATISGLDSVPASLLSRSPTPEPTRTKRVRRLILAPDGVVWIEPVQPAAISGVEVIRIVLATASQSVDTVPAFPTAFDSSGQYLAVVRSRRGGYELHRVAAGAPRP